MQGSRQRATINDALDYMRAVKETFSDQEKIYTEFLQVLKDFTAHRIDPAVVVARVKELFKGHEKLILDFNKFLPNGFRVTLSPEEKQSEWDIAFNFFKKVTLRLQGDYHVYRSFLEIMCMVSRKEKSLSEAYDKVAFLLQDYEDLLEEFTIFLPSISDQHGSSAIATNKNEHKYTADVSDADNKLNIESDHDVSDSSEDEIGLKSVCSQDCEKVNQRDPD